MSTRREAEWRFDHGAQYFTVRDPRFRRFVDSWQADGVVAPWHARIAVLDSGTAVPKGDDTERFVGVPGMNAVCRHLSDGLDVAWRTRVASLERAGGRWQLRTDDGSDLGRFEAVVVSAPAPQTAELVGGVAPAMAAEAAAVEMAPCWAVMAAFSHPLDLPFDGAFVAVSPLSWVARNASKPDRPAHESWVLHAGPEWSRDHLEIESSEAAEELWGAFATAAGGLDVTPLHLQAHRWRFALPPHPLPTPCLYDDRLALAACGDWCGGPRVEGAYLSGAAAAGRIIGLAAKSSQPSFFTP
jgi:hypothetical protein